MGIRKIAAVVASAAAVAAIGFGATRRRLNRSSKDQGDADESTTYGAN